MKNTIDHLNFLFADKEPAEYIRIFHLSPSMKGEQFLLRSIRQIESYLELKRYQKDTFVGVLPVASNGAVGSSGGVLWVDIDDYKENVSGRLLDTLEPTLRVSSGRGVHAYWKLTERVDVSEVALLNKKLTAKFGGDFQCWNPERVLRLVGTYNSRKEGAVCEIISKGPTYTLEQIKDFVKDVDIDENMFYNGEESSDYSSYTTEFSDMPQYWQDLVLKGRNSGALQTMYGVWKSDGTVDRSKMIFNVIRIAKKNNMSPDTLWEIYDMFRPAAFEKLMEEGDIRAKSYIYRIYEKVNS